MVKLSLLLKAQLNNLTNLQPSDPANCQFFFKIKCSSCREIHPNWVDISRAHEYPITGSRGVANLVWRCQLCRKESSASFVDSAQPASKKSQSYPAYTDLDSSNQSFVSLLTIECRGCEFIEFEPRGHWSCVGSSSKTAFVDVEFEDGEWHEYDEKSGLPVSVTDIETKIERA